MATTATPTPTPSETASNSASSGSPFWGVMLLWLATFVIFTALGGYFVGPLVWLLSFGLSLKWFLGSVPAAHGAVLLNVFLHELRAIPQGLSVKWPWEKVTKYFKLYLVNVEFSITLPALDNIPISIKIAFQYCPKLRWLTRYIMVDESTIAGGFTAALSGIVTHLTGQKASRTIRRKTDWLEEETLRIFEGRADEKGVTPKRVTREDLEKAYGIDVKFVTVADVDYDKEFQRALTAQKSMEILRKGAIRAMKVTRIDPDTKKSEVIAEIPYDEAWNKMLAVSGDAKLHMQIVGGEGLSALSAVIVGALQSMAETMNEHKKGLGRGASS